MTKLPADTTTFVGRREAAAGVHHALGQARLVTLIGPGGVGKTRLALRVAHSRAQRLTVEMVELADVTDPASVAGRVATAVEVRDISARDPLEAIADHFAHRRSLLVLDNCEHLLDACAGLVEHLLPRAPRLRVLATSREPLGVEGEHIWPVLPLTTPRDGQFRPGQEYEAVTLFRARAAAAAPKVTLDDALVARICQRLDGLPLAIELAVPWLRSMTARELAARLEAAGRLVLLERPRGGVPRHQTLRATIDWSADQCSVWERRLWGRLAQFPSGADLDAAEHVCADAALPVEQVLITLAGLVNKSILDASDGSGRTRYRMLETLRQYGVEMSAGEEDEVRRRHRDHYLRCLAGDGYDAWHGPDQADLLERARLDRGNVDAALSYCCATGQIHAGMELAGRLWWWWITRDLRDGRRWLQRVLEADEGPPSRERALALWACGVVACGQGDTAPALDLLREGIAVARTVGDATAEAFARQWLGMAQWMRGQFDQAAVLMQTALDYHRGHGGLTTVAAIVPAQLGMVLALLGDPDRGIELGRESVAACDAVGEHWTCSWSCWNLAVAYWSRHDHDDAVTYAMRSLRHKRELGDVLGIPFALELLAWSSVKEGDAVRAATLLGAADTMWEPVGAPLFAWSALQTWSRECRAEAQAAITGAAYRAAYQHGRKMPTADAVTYALGETPATPEAASPPPEHDVDEPPAADLLTRREREVAELIARGMTYAEIAEELTVSWNTVKTHMEHIKDKLGVNRRERIAALISRRPPTQELPPGRVHVQADITDAFSLATRGLGKEFSASVTAQDHL